MFNSLIHLSENIFLLEKEKKPLSTKEIGKKLKLNPTTIASNCARMLKYKEIKVIYLGRWRLAHYFV